MLTLARTSALRSVRALSVRANAGLHTLPDLPYAYNALEPYISAEIMTLHHTKHHAAYVAGLNAAEASYSALSTSPSSPPSSPTAAIKSQIALQAALKFNGGGHINHSLFWANLAPPSPSTSASALTGKLGEAVERDFGGVEEMKKVFNQRTAGVQGSGWGWLGWSKETGKLEVVTTANQDPLLSHTPIIGIDIWEHAFYLQYKNVKPDYLNAIWNVVNFAEAERRFVEATKA
ncbi:hypothetical protein PLICRDRAFT_702126 [Plicaturopsis crispa FD-325 SS-3]|uniref:Superoxide dismutase n=1 Tax=Plicaturopsis crispa FD-325 SS-3 TaxID=944288 RepID=A0A0C9SR00_PLICR|nr:hypothetical protein PLICRDRAFT_702126 [Plicaturopsis crispa FD-325 SS-3]